jgi:BspA type Leucine rich repeat region (6 copies)
MGDYTDAKTGIKYSYLLGKDEKNKDGVYYLYEITLPDTWSSDTPLSLVPYSKNGTDYFPTVIGNSSTAVNIKYESSDRTKKLTGLKLTCDSNEHIISIGVNAFRECSALKSINLSDCVGLTSIGLSAFQYCGALISIDLSGCTGLTSISARAFQDCVALISIDLSGRTELTTIGTNAFQYCGALTSINLSGCTQLTTIGDRAFFQCGALTSINLSGCDQLTTIGNSAFAHCGALTSINFSGCKKLITIVTDAFLNNPNLKNIIIENMDKKQLLSLIGILKEQNIGTKINTVKIVDKNMQICLS